MNTVYDNVLHASKPHPISSILHRNVVKEDRERNVGSGRTVRSHVDVYLSVIGRATVKLTAFKCYLAVVAFHTQYLASNGWARSPYVCQRKTLDRRVSVICAALEVNGKAVEVRECQVLNVLV